MRDYDESRHTWIKLKIFVTLKQFTKLRSSVSDSVANMVSAINIAKVRSSSERLRDFSLRGFKYRFYLQIGYEIEKFSITLKSLNKLYNHLNELKWQFKHKLKIWHPYNWFGFYFVHLLTFELIESWLWLRSCHDPKYTIDVTLCVRPRNYCQSVFEK